MTKVNLERIKQLRKLNKLSQEEMADKLGFNTKYPYHRKELGNQAFTAEELQHIAHIFGKPMEYFFNQDVAINATGQEVC
jgi:transcriptional regulator with XRE-family HTH domain